MELRKLVSRCLNAAARKMASIAEHIGDPILLELRRRKKPRICYLSLRRDWIQRYGFRTVLDVGANVGQFAVATHALLPDAAIYSFEPLPDCFEALQREFAGKPLFRAFNVALGASSGEMKLNRSRASASSSILQMANLHRQIYPWTEATATVSVRAEPLDYLLEPLCLAEPILLKIDVQGYEDQVLRGGELTARRAAVIIIETSFETLYEGQPLFNDIYCTLTRWGFAYKGSLEQVADPASGRALYADSIFVRGDAFLRDV